MKDVAFYAIVAVANNGVIGLQGGMPWHLSTDLQRFKKLTSGYPIIMGHKTWQSLPKRPLPKRMNIVLSRHRSGEGQGMDAVHAQQDKAEVVFVASVEEAKEEAKRAANKLGVEAAFVMGGGQIYKAFLPDIKKIFMTKVLVTLQGDTVFPALKEKEWHKQKLEDIPRGEKDSVDSQFWLLTRSSDAG